MYFSRRDSIARSEGFGGDSCRLGIWGRGKINDAGEGAGIRQAGSRAYRTVIVWGRDKKHRRTGC
jgi:hypothetical protein